MSKTAEDFKSLFSQINSKLGSTDPDDVKNVASQEFKQVVESLLYEFQASPLINDFTGDVDVFSIMSSRFKAFGFDEKAINGAWQSLGIAHAIDGPRQLRWEEQTDDIVAVAPKSLLDVVTRAYSGALTDDQRKPAGLTEQKVEKSPAEFKELFGQVHAKLTSKEPGARELVVSDEFKTYVESLARELQAIAPGAEGMMTYAKENGFDGTEVSGVWMSIGISAATAGSFQADWAQQVQRLIANVGGEPGFHQFVNAMVDAYTLANNGVPHPEFSTHQNFYTGNSLSNYSEFPFGGPDVYRFPTQGRVPSGFEKIREWRGGNQGAGKPAAGQAKIDIDEIILDMQESPEVKQAIQDIAKNMAHDSFGKTSRKRPDDEGPGL